MVILLKGCENIRSSLAFFDKAKGNKIVPSPSILCWDDGIAKFEQYTTKAKNLLSL
jgi:hypothetical protein